MKDYSFSIYYPKGYSPNDKPLTKKEINKMANDLWELSDEEVLKKYGKVHRQERKIE